MQLALGLKGVTTTSDLESFSCRTFLDNQFLISARQDTKYETLVKPGSHGTYGRKR